jgi:hypothetical protein
MSHVVCCHIAHKKGGKYDFEYAYAQLKLYSHRFDKTQGKTKKLKYFLAVVIEALHYKLIQNQVKWFFHTMTSLLSQQHEFDQYQKMDQERKEFSNLSENAKMTRVYNQFANVLQNIAEMNGEEADTIDPDDLMNLSRKIAKRVNEKNQSTRQDKDVMESFSSYYDECINDQSEEIKYIYDVSYSVLYADADAEF